MLRYRLITAFVLILLMLFAIFKLPVTWFALLCAAITMLAGWEWTKLMGLSGAYPRVGYLVLIAIFLLTIPYNDPRVVFGAAAVLWASAIRWVIRYPKESARWSKKYILGIIGIIMLVSCWFALVELRAADLGTYLVLYLLSLVYVADSGAYFVGRWLGKHHLAPVVSPKKTV